MSKKADRAAFLEHIHAIESIENGLADALSEATHLEELSSSTFLDKEQMAGLHDLVQLVMAADEKVSEINSLFADEIEAANETE